jgi:hypothetical protein
MSNLRRRIEQAEKKLGVEDKKSVVVVILTDFPKIDEPLEEWLTYKEAMEERRRQRRTGHVAFVADPAREAEARRTKLNETERSE